MIVKVLDAYEKVSEKGNKYTMFSYVTEQKDGHKRYATELFKGEGFPKVGDTYKANFTKVGDQWVLTHYSKEK